MQGSKQYDNAFGTATDESGDPKVADRWVPKSKALSKVYDSGGFRDKDIYQKAVLEEQQFDIPVSNEKKEYSLRFLHLMSKPMGKKAQEKGGYTIIYGGTRDDLQTAQRGRFKIYGKAQEYHRHTRTVDDAYKRRQELASHSDVTADDVKEAVAMYGIRSCRGCNGPALQIPSTTRRDEPTRTGDRSWRKT